MAQLDSASDSESEGCRFESGRGRQRGVGLVAMTAVSKAASDGSIPSPATRPLHRMYSQAYHEQDG